MPRDKKKYQLDDEKKIKLIQGSQIINLATINKDGTPHLVPMWFIVDENNEINFTSYNKSQKIINLKRDKRIVKIGGIVKWRCKFEEVLCYSWWIVSSVGFNATSVEIPCCVM